MHWAGLSKKKPMLEEGPPTKEELKWQLHDKTESKCECKRYNKNVNSIFFGCISSAHSAFFTFSIDLLLITMVCVQQNKMQLKLIVMLILILRNIPIVTH